MRVMGLRAGLTCYYGIKINTLESPDEPGMLDWVTVILSCT